MEPVQGAANYADWAPENESARAGTIASRPNYDLDTRALTRLPALEHSRMASHIGVV
jgi:hypothetical protein